MRIINVRDLNEGDISNLGNHNRAKIKALKNELANSDYKTLKFLEGEMSAEEYAPVKEQRKLWRKQINILEVEGK